MIRMCDYLNPFQIGLDTCMLMHSFISVAGSNSKIQFKIMREKNLAQVEQK